MNHINASSPKECNCVGCISYRKGVYHDPCDCESYEKCYGKEVYAVHYLQYPGQAPYQKRYINWESDSE